MHYGKLASAIAAAKKAGWADWIQSANDEAAVLAGCHFSKRRAWHAVDFFPRFLRHHKPPAAGEPFHLAEWQRDKVIAPIFGWLRPDGTRRFRIVYLEFPKKSGKSALTSGALLYCHTADGEPGPESYCAGTDQKSAMIVYRESAAMVRSSPDLRHHLNVKNSELVIENRGAPECFIRPLSRESANAEGVHGHFVGIDELHLWKDREFYHILKYAGRARRQPLLWQITTAGADLTSICYEEHDYANDVMHGRIIDWSYFPLIYAADPKDDWTDRAVHKKANPGYGITIDPEVMMEECRRAQRKPSERANFKRRCLNIWGEAEDRFFDMSKFTRCSADIDVAGRVPVASLDLSSSKDTTALTLTFPPRGLSASKEDPYVQMTYYWIPEAKATEEGDSTDKASYRYWVEEGWIRTTPGDFVDLAAVFEDIRDLREVYGFDKIALDRAMAAHMMVLLENEGLEVIPWAQNYAGMDWPMRYLEQLVGEGHHTHLGNPVTVWQADKCKAKRNATGQMMLIKRIDRGRIDGPVTMVMGIGATFMQDPDDSPGIDSIGEAA